MRNFSFPSDSALKSFFVRWNEIGGHRLDSIGMEEDAIDWFINNHLPEDATDEEINQFADMIYEKSFDLGFGA